MRSRVTVAAVVLAAVLVAPVSARAAEPLRRPVPGAVLLAFGVPYDSRVHHGLDLSAEEGESVSAPSAGVVTFAGRLPGEDGALGVTLQTDSGLKVTCLPLAGVKVAKGERLSAGAKLGQVSAEGDGSSERPHVHLSVRQGETYVDPAPLLEAAPVAEEPDAAEPEPETAVEPEREAADARVDAQAADAPGGAAAGAAQPAGASSGAGAVQSAPPITLASPAGAPAPAHLTPLRDAAAAALGRHAISSPRRISRVSPAASQGALSALVARARSGVALVAEALMALALLWPVWRKLSQPTELHEPLPVRARS